MLCVTEVDGSCEFVTTKCWRFAGVSERPVPVASITAVWVTSFDPQPPILCERTIYVLIFRAHTTRSHDSMHAISLHQLATTFSVTVWEPFRIHLTLVKRRIGTLRVLSHTIAPKGYLGNVRQNRKRPSNRVWDLMSRRRYTKRHLHRCLRTQLRPLYLCRPAP